MGIKFGEVMADARDAQPDHSGAFRELAGSITQLLAAEAEGVTPQVLCLHGHSWTSPSGIQNGMAPGSWLEECDEGVRMLMGFEDPEGDVLGLEVRMSESDTGGYRVTSSFLRDDGESPIERWEQDPGVPAVSLRFTGTKLGPEERRQYSSKVAEMLESWGRSRT